MDVFIRSPLFFFGLSESFLQDGSESSRFFFFFFFSWTLYKFYVSPQSENWQIRTCEEKLSEETQPKNHKLSPRQASVVCASA